MVEIMVEDTSRKLCIRCHRELKDAKSKRLGYGPICYKKYLERNRLYLFDMPDYKTFNSNQVNIL